jgi:predicted methyltransferase
VNVHHELEGTWPFTARQAFHYIRGFALGGVIADYDGLYRNAYKHLLPGGWFEVRDHDLQFFVDTQGGDKEKEEVT